jgi:hypothetical protein
VEMNATRRLSHSGNQSICMEVSIIDREGTNAKETCRQRKLEKPQRNGNYSLVNANVHTEPPDGTACAA